jgi:hypothetical protein
VVVGALAAPLEPAGAQWWPFKRRRPPQPPAATAPVRPTEPAPEQPAAPPPADAALAAQAADRERYLREARARELTRDTTAQNAQDRLTAWSLVRAIDPADPEAAQGHARARDDLALARRREQAARVQAADSAERAQVRTQLRGAQAAMQGGDVRSAEAQVSQALAVAPDDPQARSLQAAIAARRRSDELRRLYLLLGGGMLLGGGGVGYVAWRAVRSARDRARERAAARQANLQVIDGVGRGRFVPITGPVFRIGAVASELPEERNDLVISDAARMVSRHHCTILKREGEYYLVDASLNGTWLNGVAVPRGEQHRLDDGDELVVADAARLRFLVT